MNGTSILRNTIITINNPTKEEVTTLKELPYTFMCYQHEKGKKETPHLHAYVELTKRGMKFNTLKKKLPRARIERRKGTQEQAIAYCTKERTRTKGPYTYGEKKEQGKRSDLDVVKTKLDAGKNMLEIADEHWGSFVRYHKSFEHYLYLKATTRTVKPKVTVLWGPTNTGKSHTAAEMAKEIGGEVYYKDNTKWWNGYSMQEVVIWDDFEMSCINYNTNYLLKLLDKYPFQVETKGGYVKFNSPHIIFTTNFDPEEWTTEERTKKALARRFSTIVHMTQTVPEVSEGNTMPHSPDELEYDNWYESKDIEYPY